MNPHQKETRYINYLGENNYQNVTKWFDTGLWAEAGGFALIICTITINTGSHGNAGFRLVDENNEPLPPFRAASGNRIPVHFSMEPEPMSGQDLTPVTFHMIVNCKYVKLQVRADDGNFRINTVGYPGRDTAWNHMAISTMSTLPLIPDYQGGANKVFSYPQSRMPRLSGEEDKKSFKPLKKNRPNSDN